MEFRRHFDRWGWLISLTLLSLIALRFFWGRDAFCGPAGEHCLREWASALGAWVAIPSALAGVLYLGRQINLMEQQLKDTTAASDNHSRIVARRAAAQAKCAMIAMEAIETRATSGMHHTQETLAILAKEIGEAADLLVQEDLAAFESQIPGAISGKEAATHIKTIGRVLTSISVQHADAAAVPAMILQLGAILHQYCNFIIQHAKIVEDRPHP